MESIKQPKMVTYYQLLKLSTKLSLSIHPCGAVGATNYIGTGMYTTLQEAEHNRTIEILREVDATHNGYYIFELEFPNPAYQE